jgi:hypothetical protein
MARKLRLGKTPRQVQEDAKAADWKVAIATHLRTRTTASNPWLAAALNMGAPAALSRYVGECRAGERPGARRSYGKISKG